MAQPFGLQAVRHLSGGSMAGTLEYKSIASGYATNIGAGDLIKEIATGGNIEKATTAGEDFFGVFVALSYVDARSVFQPAQFWPASTTATKIKVQCLADPDIVFHAVDFADSGNLDEDDIGANIDMTVNQGVRTNVGGLSKEYLDVTRKDATARQLNLIGLADIPGNDYGKGAVWEVRFNKARFQRNSGI